MRPIIFVAMFALAACGTSSNPVAPPPPQIGGSQPPPTVSRPVLASISPATAPAGTADLRITLNGSGFVQDFPHHTQPLLGWGPIASRAYLATGFVSESELTATVPANLLRTEGTVQSSW